MFLCSTNLPVMFLIVNYKLQMNNCFLGFQGPPTVVIGAPTAAGGPRMYN